MKMLQTTTRQFVVRNHTALGRELRVFANANIDLLDQHGHGWLDGGCRTFAEALSVWSNGQINPVYIHSGHVVGQIGNVYIDADGVATLDDLIKKMSIAEQVGPPADDEWVKEYDPEDCDDNEIFLYELVHAELVRRLRRHFGDFDPAMLPELNLSLPPKLSK